MNKKNLRHQLKIDEGVVNTIYTDHLGHKTFGVGHLIKRTDPEWTMSVGTTIKATRIDEVFEEDLNNAIQDCEKLFEDFNDWPCEVQEVLVNMMFNLGYTKLSKFVTFKKFLIKKDWKGAAEQGRKSLWYEQVTKRAERLMSRLERVS